MSTSQTPSTGQTPSKGQTQSTSQPSPAGAGAGQDLLGAVATAPEEVPAAGTALAVSSEVVANSLGEYVNAWWRRVRSGDSGVLPVVVAIALVTVGFEILNGRFLSPTNLVNLFTQSVVYILFAMGEVFVLLLGEIDLSMVFVAGIGAGIMAFLVAPPYDFPWWLAILVGLGATTICGLIMGALVTLFRLPAFIVTLAGFIGWQGVMLWMFNKLPVAVGGVISISNRVFNDLMNGNISPLASWIGMALAVIAFAAYSIFRDMRRAAQGLVTPPMSLTVLKAGAVAVAGVGLVLLCNVNRGALAGSKEAGVPWSIPILLVIFGLVSFLLARTRFGRYVYAIGGNTEAARRAGINTRMIRTIAFGFTGLMAGLAGLMYLSQLGSIATDIDPTYVLFAVAAAVIGGTSLFGGRGKPLHAILGGIVIAGVSNGILLVGWQTDVTYMITALVLIAAVMVDSLARRGRRA